jgi:hypothetical protein
MPRSVTCLVSHSSTAIPERYQNGEAILVGGADMILTIAAESAGFAGAERPASHSGQISDSRAALLEVVAGLSVAQH